MRNKKIFLPFLNLRLLLASTAKIYKKGVRSLGLEKKAKEKLKVVLLLMEKKSSKEEPKNYVNLSLTHFQPQ